MTVACLPKRPEATRPSAKPGPPPFAGLGPKYVAPEGYNIRHDPEATDKIATLLLEGWRDHPGEPVLLGQALGTSDVWAVRCHVEALRRLGWVIRATKGVPGYTLLGFAAPPKWTHIDNVLRDVVRESAKTEGEPPSPGQMELL